MKSLGEWSPGSLQCIYPRVSWFMFEFLVLFLSILSNSCYFALVSFSACTSVAHDECFSSALGYLYFPSALPCFLCLKAFYLTSFSLMFLQWILLGSCPPCSSLTQDLFVTQASEDWPKVCSEGHLCSLRMSSPQETAGSMEIEVLQKLCFLSFAREFWHLVYYIPLLSFYFIFYLISPTSKKLKTFSKITFKL